jgi:RNA polymerase sigma-70 factor, ECF subfamily
VCHARARIAEDTDWVRIAALYDALLEVIPSPIVALNRAVAVGFAYGPAAGLEAVEELRFEKSLEGYYLLASVRGDLLARLGRGAEAAFEFRRAAAATANLRERTLLLDRAKAASDVDFAARRSTPS